MIAIVTIEIANGIGQIGNVNRKSMIGNQILRVIIETENAAVLGGIGHLHIKRMKILRIGAAITEIINIGQQSSLETLVRIVSHTGQYAESPTLADAVFGLFLFVNLFFFAEIIPQRFLITF